MSIKLLNDIKCILINSWDPIGIYDIIEAQDEYDTYAFQIYKMRNTWSEKDIYNYLTYLEDNHIECSTSTITRKNVTSQILQKINNPVT